MELRPELQDRSEIMRWSRCYNVPYDTCIENLVEDVKNRGYLKKNELIKVACWKVRTGRNTVWRVKRICHDDVKEITCKAFRLTDDSESIRCLLSKYGLLAGVDWAVASAILHWFHFQGHESRYYPIWDKNARKSLQITKGNYCGLNYWKAYVKYCRDIACQYEVDMRTLDRALFEYGKTIC